MKFIDEAIITVQSGDGGHGCVSFRREKYVPRGGPDGGDGGKGGDIVLRCTSRLRTLYPFQFKREFKARHGAPGRGKQMTGKNGADSIIEIPPGTLVRDADTNEVIKDFDKSGEDLIVANGGRGGQGNYRFKTSVNRAPRFAQSGEPGQSRTLKLELKLLADVGIIGLPNAGKSTLISVISSASPKIAPYPFTTLIPNLGVVKAVRGEPFVVADIPGLIAGAHEGAGLGTRFLRHIERTCILIHLIDGSAIQPDNPLDAYETVNKELTSYSPLLAEKPQLVVLNKMDLAGADQAAKRFQDTAESPKVSLISALTGTGINQLLSKVIELLDQYRNE